MDDLLFEGSEEAFGQAIGLGSLTKAKLGAMPQNLIWFRATSNPSRTRGGLLDRFRQSVQGKAADSWVGTGPNEPVSPGQLGNALGPNIIKTLAERSGLSEDELLTQLSQVLPGAVDKLTPKGRLPTLAELAE